MGNRRGDRFWGRGVGSILLWAVWAVGLTTLLGCGAKRFYPGPKKPKTEVAVVHGTYDPMLGKICVTPIPQDPTPQMAQWYEQKNPSGCYSTVHLLPGSYRLEISIGSSMMGATGGTKSLSRTLMAGHVYQVRVVPRGPLTGNVSLEDLTSGGSGASIEPEAPEAKWLSAPLKAPNKLDFTLAEDEAKLHDAFVGYLEGKLGKLAIEGVMRIRHVEDESSVIENVAAAMGKSADAMPQLEAVDGLLEQHIEQLPLVEAVLRRLVMRSLFKLNVADNLANANQLTSLVPHLRESGETDARLVRILLGGIRRVFGNKQAKAIEAARDELAKPFGGFPAAPAPPEPPPVEPAPPAEPTTDGGAPPPESEAADAGT